MIFQRALFDSQLSEMTKAYFEMMKLDIKTLNIKTFHINNLGMKV